MNFGQTPITDEQLVKLTPLSNLRFLDLPDGSNLSSEGLKTLAQMKSLKGLILFGTENPESRDGPLWVGGLPPELTANFGQRRDDWHGDLWHYDDSGWQRQTLEIGSVRTIHESRDDTIWVGTDSGLWHYEDSGPQPVRIAGANVIHESNDETLWVGNSGGLWRYEKDANLDQLPKNLDQLLNSVYCSCGCSRETIGACGCPVAQETIASFEEQLALGETIGQVRAEYLAEHGPGFDAILDSGWESVAGVTGSVYAIHESKDGTLWVGSSSGDGLWRNQVCQQDDCDGNGWELVAGSIGLVEVIH